MSTSPYSYDLRKKVINYLSKGKSQKEASEVFGLHINTVHRWNVRCRDEGNYASRKRLGQKSKLDYKKIELFVLDNSDVKLSDIAAEFGISNGYASLILKRLGFSYKKKRLPIWKQTKESEKNIKKL